MRSMRYRFELEAGDEGYLVYNAETTWNAMPQEENLQRPSIRVKNVPICGKIVADIASCVEVNEFYGDTFEPENDNDLKDERIRHNIFAANYARILKGEFPDWVLGVVRINSSGVTMAFFDRETGQFEDLHVKWTPMLWFMFEVDRADGSGVDTYLAKMSADNRDTEKNRHLEIIEQDAYGKRKLVFTSLYDESDGPDERWKYVHVTEYR
jgi:hypothetical protein